MLIAQLISIYVLNVIKSDDRTAKAGSQNLPQVKSGESKINPG